MNLQIMWNNWHYIALVQQRESSRKSAMLHAFQIKKLTNLYLNTLSIFNLVNFKRSSNLFYFN